MYLHDIRQTKSLLLSLNPSLAMSSIPSVSAVVLRGTRNSLFVHQARTVNREVKGHTQGNMQVHIYTVSHNIVYTHQEKKTLHISVPNLFRHHKINTSCIQAYTYLHVYAFKYLYKVNIYASFSFPEVYIHYIG